MPVRKYPKRSRERLGRHFLACEFDCPCPNCTETLIDPELVAGLERLRDDLGVPIRITSGYRCPAHQAELASFPRFQTAKVSKHPEGKAADLQARGFTGPELEERARAVGFEAVGVGGTWIHVDTRRGKVRRWAYRGR